MIDSAADAEAGGGLPPGRSEPLREALDHLLDPLDFLSSRVGAEAVQELDPRSMFQSRWEDGGRVIPALLMLPRRLRRSPRLRYRIPRLVIAWFSLGLVVFGLIWLVVALPGPR